MTALDWVRLAVLAAVAVATVHGAVAGPPAPLAWGMFTRVRFCRIEAPGFDQWRWFPYENLPMGVATLERLLDFLAARGAAPAAGTVTVVDGPRSRRWDIVDGSLDL